MGFRSILVWTSATLGVAESHKNNVQSTYQRRFMIEVVYFTSHKRVANFILAAHPQEICQSV
jgi:hypothetical protein